MGSLVNSPSTLIGACVEQPWAAAVQRARQLRSTRAEPQVRRLGLVANATQVPAACTPPGSTARLGPENGHKKTRPSFLERV
jgi:hypothetical protein